jgi:hypothetical protein
MPVPSLASLLCESDIWVALLRDFPFDFGFLYLICDSRSQIWCIYIEIWPFRPSDVERQTLIYTFCLHFLILPLFDLPRFFLAADGWNWCLIFAFLIWSLGQYFFLVHEHFFSCAHVRAVLFQFVSFLIFFFFTLANCTSNFFFCCAGYRLKGS